MCGDRNAWNPNCVIVPEQTLVLPVKPQPAGSERIYVCKRREDNSMSPANKESIQL